MSTGTETITFPIPTGEAATTPISNEPRGGPLDFYQAAHAMRVAPTPGSEERAREATYRGMLIARLREQDAQLLNTAARGTLEGGAAGIGMILLKLLIASAK